MTKLRTSSQTPGQRSFRALSALLAVALCAPALALGAPPHAATAQQGVAETPGQLVLDNSQRVIRTLSARRAEFQSNPVALHDFIRSEFTQMFDRVYAARLVLGRNGRTASDSDVRAFADALAENLMHRYGTSLLEVNPGLNVKLASETALRNGTIVKVKSLIDRRDGAPVPVDYLMHRVTGKWQVFDVIVEGISFVQTFRTQFADDLRTKSLAQLTNDLRAGKVQAEATTERQ